MPGGRAEGPGDREAVEPAGA